MIRPFHEGQKIYFSTAIHARSSASLGAGLIIVNQGAEGITSGYSEEGTPEKLEDDFVGIKITEGDEAVGKIVWVPASEFDKLTKS